MASNTVSDMGSAERRDAPNILSLPQDLLIDIGSCLRGADLCNIETANKSLHAVLSRPNRTGCGEWALDLSRLVGTHDAPLLSAKALRWFKNRIMRYSFIKCEFHREALFEGGDEPKEGLFAALPPALLPVFLAACAPSTELALSAHGDQGEEFLAMSSESIAPGASPEHISFWTSLKHHLTSLRLVVCAGKARAEHFGALGMLTALQELSIGSAFPPSSYEAEDKTPRRDLLGQKLALKLPHLTSLEFQCFKHVELILSSPKLATVEFLENKSMHIILEDAFLQSLGLVKCKKVMFAMHAPENQLQHLDTLCVRDCSEEGGYIIESVGLMKNLRALHYTDFPAACMPSAFPQKLEEVALYPLGWCDDLPEGLRGLQKLKSFHFNTTCNSWKVSRPLAELLPMASLRCLTLASYTYQDEEIRQGERLIDLDSIETDFEPDSKYGDSDEE